MEDLTNAKIIEGEMQKQIDVSQYAGKRVKIAGVENYESQFSTETKVSFRVFTEVIDVVPREDGGDINIVGSVILNFNKDEDGNLLAHPTSRAYTFFKHYGITSLGELVGKECRVEPLKGYLTIETA